MIEYANVPRTLGTLVSAKLATLHELDTVYGVYDLWMLLELNTVNNYNHQVVNEYQEQLSKA